MITAVFVLLLVSILVFLAMHFLPGDPVLIHVSSSRLAQITQAELDQLRHEYGLDKSLPVQYFDWMSGVVHGDFGLSIAQQKPVWDMISSRVPISLYLGFLALIVFLIIGIPAGTICALRRGTWVDNVVTSLANLGLTAPVFWVGILMIWVIGLELKWLPIYGYTSPFEDFWTSTRQIVMPVICLALFPIASTARQTRSAMLEVMRQDYIRTAWSKGLKERMIIIRHAMKNGLLPVVILIGLSISNILGGEVLVETIFNIPGMGRLTVTAILNHDYPVVQGIVLIIASSVVLINLLVDLSCGWLDPRIRYE